MNRQPTRDWIPVAPTWERDPEDKDIWKRVVIMPSLALNRAETDFLGIVAGRHLCILGGGESSTALALAAMGARVTVVDPTHSLLDIIMVRTQIVGVEIQYLAAELADLSGIRDGSFQLAYAAQAASEIRELDTFYEQVFRILRPGGRLVVNEYHPFRRVWKHESGAPRIAHSYFERRTERPELDTPSPVTPGHGLGQHEYHWTVSDHFFFLTQAGFRVAGLEEVGEVRQRWELPNLRGLPEQLIIAADRPE